MFEAPEVSAAACFWTGLGALVLWMEWRARRLNPYVFNDIIRERFGIKDPWAVIVDVVMFVALGILVGVAMVEPRTAPQAIAAGLGWTGLLTRFRLDESESG